MKRKISILLRGICLTLLSTFSLVLSAQNLTLRGTVADVEGDLLIGVTVQVQGTTLGTVTDVNGNFTLLNVPPDAVIEISYVGMRQQVIALNGRTSLQVILEEDTELLEELVVIGYGTQRREAVTGSVSSMEGNKMRELAASNISQSLQGRVPGVEMTPNSTRPGAAMDIRIRGTRSLTASNDPLVVLDGIPFPGSIGDINPNDIRSIDILKDASATAIYGSRGANGVILVTTYRGTSAGIKPIVNYNGYLGAKTLFSKYPMMDAAEYIQYRDLAGKFTDGASEDRSLNIDWQDLMFETGIVTSHDASISSVTNRGGAYSFSTGYYDETTVLPGQSYERFSLRGSFDQQLGERVKVGLSSINSYSLTDGERDSPLQSTLNFTPITNPYNEDGSINTGKIFFNNMDSGYSPLTVKSLGDRHKDQRKAYASYNSFYGEVSILDGLKYRMNLGLNYRQSNYGNYRGAKTIYNGNDELNAGIIENVQTTNWAVENLLYYDKTFSDKHNLNLVAMYSAEQTEYNKSHISALGIASDLLQFYNFGLLHDDGEITINPNNQVYYKRGLLSGMFRAMYAYDNRYMLTAVIRSDGSSVLAEGHKWHTYPAVSLGWNLGNENFMKSVSSISELKLRVGYGQTSNQAIQPYQTLGGLATNYYNFGERNVSGYYVSNLPNYNLGWEYSTTWNFGVDFSLLNRRINGTIEYYSQITDDVLVAQRLPQSSGVSGSFLVNMGKTENKGLEFNLNGIILNNHNGWDWDVGFNIYTNKNKILELASGQMYDKGNGWFVGSPINSIYDFKKIGIWQKGEEEEVVKYEGSTAQVGMIKVEYTGDFDDQGNPVRQIGRGTTLDDDDRQILGSIDPDFQGGFNTRIGYKNLDLTLIGNYKSGGILVSTLHSNTSYLNQQNGRVGQIKIDYWTEDNPTNAYPSPKLPDQNNHPYYTTTLAYFDGSYIKISAITLGYNIPDALLKKFNIDRLRIYGTVQNPFVFASDYYSETGLDPQPNSEGRQNQSVPENSVVPDRINVVGFNTPATRNFMIGLNVTF